MSVVLLVATPRCMFCLETSVVEVAPDRYARWLAGELIQDVWPDWTKGQRELLITGTHPECWDKAFADEGPITFDSIDIYGNDPYEKES